MKDRLQKLFAYGYRSFEREELDYPPVKQSVEVVVRLFRPPDYRPPTMVSLGPHLEGFAPPHPDPSCRITMQSGAFKRFCREVPIPDPVLLGRFRQFVQKWIEENLTQLPEDTDVTFDTWLKNTNYPEWRREDLRKQWENSGGILTAKHFIVKSFMKDETYPEFKHARGINARHDVFKCAVGPYFKLIEEQLYNHPAFIKHIPVPDRPEYIRNLLHVLGGRYVATDYTAYESHFTAEMMESCEFLLYDYMTKNLPGHDDFMHLCRDVIAGSNVCQYKMFDVKLEATRMSGEMNTSLGNGFSNLMAFLFLCHEKHSECVGVVEGDDGLFRVIGEIPTAEDFEKLGFTIKIELHSALEEASFCGIIFDLDDCVNVANPAQALLNFGWAGMRHVPCKSIRHMELLRAKSLSFLYQYPGCPIIQSLAQYGLRVTKHVDLSRFLEKTRAYDMHKRAILQAAWEERFTLVGKPVPKNTRDLVERKFGVTIGDQLAIEAYLDSLTTLQPLYHWTFDFIMSKASVEYFHQYVLSQKEDYPDLWGLEQYAGQLDKYEEHIKFAKTFPAYGHPVPNWTQAHNSGAL